MQTYSVAIRTLGTSQTLKQELVSLHNQTVMPEEIVVYIAKGYSRPDYTIGKERYVWVDKGMVAQRALEYRELNSDCVLLLDDDVEFAPDSVERMLKVLEDNDADCVGADTFKNHNMSMMSKIYATITNLVFPHWGSTWAFKIHSNGSFSYNNNPNGGFYLSQSCAGPCSLWKKKSLLKLRWQDEMWLEKMGFAYGDDVLEFYKLYINGGKLGIFYDSGVKNLDGKVASGDYQKNIKKFYVRSFANFAIWHRTIYSTRRHFLSKLYSAIAVLIKIVWLFPINVIAGIVNFNIRIPYYYVKGVMDAIKYIHSDEYKSISPYLIEE